jgi:hypothetical protein
MHRYAGWFVLDLRLLVFVLLVGILLTAGTLAIGFRKRQWAEIVSAGFSLYIMIVAGLIVLLNVVFYYPVFRVESFFPF